MKKRFQSAFAVLLACLCLVPMTAFAAENSDVVPAGGYVAEDPTQDDTVFTQDELLILEAAQDYGATPAPCTNGLITSASLKFSMKNCTMLISGMTKCVSTVKKCGFTKVVIKRRQNASYSWQSFQTYKDLYANNNTYVLSKKVNVTPGYYYYLEGVHYAKKNALSTQKFTSETSVQKV